MGLKQIRMRSRRAVAVGGLVLIAAFVASVNVLLEPAQPPVTDAPSGSGQASVALSDLPRQGQDVMNQIRRGGPFRYDKDGTVFGNRERLLPGRTHGFYREYTVPTPGLDHRGARRIVCGGQKPRNPDACFYTADHYSSFRLILQ